VTILEEYKELKRANCLKGQDAKLRTSCETAGLPALQEEVWRMGRRNCLFGESKLLRPGMRPVIMLVALLTLLAFQVPVWADVFPDSTAWVDSNEPDDQHCDEDKLHIRVKQGREGIELRRTYLYFDNVTLSGTVTSAKLYIEADKEGGRVGIYTTSWSGGCIDWDSAPTPGYEITSKWVSGDTFFDITAAIPENGSLGLLLKMVDESSEQHVDFTNPYIEITYGTAPVASDDDATVDEDSIANVIDVLANDSSVDGGTLWVSTFDATSVNGGIVADNGDGTVLTYTPAPDFNGADSFTYEVSDGYGGTDIATVTITISGVNDAPMVSDIPDQIIAEGDSFATIDLDDYVDDVDNTDAEITWFYSGNSELTVEIANRVATIIVPDENWNGDETITFIASDPDGGSDDDWATFTVGSVNNPPVVSDIPDQTIDEGGSFATISLDDYVDDVDNTDAEITWFYSGSSELTVTIDGDRVATITVPDANWSGSQTITFEASDADGGSDDDWATFTVDPVNNPPVVSDIPDQTIAEGDSFATIDLDDYVNDVDNSADDMTWSYSGNSELTVDITDRVVTIIVPSENWNGDETITFRATDPGSLFDEDSATFTVGSVNNPSVVSDIPDQTIAEGDSFATISLDDYVDDVDNPDSHMTWSYSGNSELTVDITDRVATITVPSENWNGDETITFEASDPDGGSDNNSAIFTVNPVNDAPVATNDSATTSEDTPVTIDVLSNDTDVDGDSLTATSVSTPAHGSASVNTDGTVTYTPNADYNGTDSFTYKATDGAADSNEATVAVTVEVTEVVVGEGGSSDVEVAITSPQSGLITETSELTITFEISGTDLSSATFLHNGEETAIAPESGAITVTLAPEENTLEVRATNSAGIIASSEEITVQYDVPPLLEVIITDPPALAFAGNAGALVTVAFVEVVGTVSDPAVTEATLILDGTDRTVIPVVSGEFRHELALEKEGLNTIRAEATDARGNTDLSGTVGVIYVPEKLDVEVEHPTDGDITSSEAYDVYGTITHSAVVTTTTLYLNGAAREIVLAPESGEGGGYNYSFNEAITLREGENTLAVEGIDGFGNSGSSNTISVTLDTTAPEVTITTPATGYLTNQDSVVVTGTVDDPAVSEIALDVNDTEQTIVVTEGSFSEEIGLIEGTNTIDASAVDPLGNEGSSETVVVTYNEGAPAVSITSPSGGTKTNSSFVVVDYTVAGEAISAAFILNGVSEGITAESGSRQVSLVEGPNTLEVRASGGTITASSGIVTVISDTTAPSMSSDVSEPWETVLITVYSDEALSSPPTVEVVGGSTTEIEMALTGVRQWTGSYEIPEDGSYFVNVSGTDEAGNTGFCTTSFSRRKESVSAAPGDTITVLSERLQVDIVVGEEVIDQSVSTVHHYEDPELGRTTEPAIFVRVKAGIPLRWAMTSMTIKVFYDPAELSEGVDETTLGLYLWTPSKGGYHPIEGATVDMIEHSITGTVTY